MTNRIPTPPDARTVIVGVDTHKHVHVAVAIDSWGSRLRDHAFVVDSGGYQALITWAETHGRIEAFGIEGTGSYGAGLARAVRRAGHRVVEVNRGDRRTRRRRHRHPHASDHRSVSPMSTFVRSSGHKARSQPWSGDRTAMFPRFWSTMGPTPVSGVLEGVGEPGRILTSDPRLSHNGTTGSNSQRVGYVASWSTAQRRATCERSRS